MTTEIDIIQKATSSAKWAFLVEIVNRSIPPLTILILTQILAPEVFGEIASISIIINFLQIFVDFGLGKALVQTQEDLDSAANQVFWISLGMGTVIYGILWILAPSVQFLFEGETSNSLIRVLGLQVLFFSLSTCQQMMLVRELRFKRLFILKLISTAIPAFLSIPIALLGGGVWALVAGNVAGAVVNMLILWIQSPWRPYFDFHFTFSKKLLTFGIWALLEGLGNWFYWWGDNLFVRISFGEAALGIYQISWSLVSAVFALSVSSFVSVLFPTFSKLVDQPDILISTFRKINIGVIMVALPVGFGLAITAPLIQEIFFSTGWEFISFAIQNFGILFGLSWIVGINYELYRAIGRPDINTKILFGALIFYLPIYWISSQYGIYAFIFGRFFASIIATLVHWIVAVKVLNLKKSYLVEDTLMPLLASLAMVGVASLLYNGLDTITINAVLLLLLIIISSLLTYSCVLLVFYRSQVRNGIHFFRKAISRDNK